MRSSTRTIKEVGVLQPVVARSIPAKGRSEKLKEFLAEKPDARYELIMGERRLRASELAGETTIPAIIRETEDGDLLRDALLENLHRAQLNPLEEASAYQQLMADFGATQASPVRSEEGGCTGHHRGPCSRPAVVVDCGGNGTAG